MMDCSQCIFSENIVASGGPWGGPQTGCSVGRLEILKKKNKAEYKDGCYHLKQFCNMYRTIEWKEKQTGDLAERAKLEVKPSFGIVIYDDSDDRDNIEQTIKSIKNIDYNKKEYGIVLSLNNSNVQDRGDSMQYFVDMSQRMKEEGYFFLFTLHSYNDDSQYREYECFRKISRGSYLIKLLAGQELHPNTFNIIDDELNNKVNQIVLFDDEKRNVSIINKAIANNVYYNYFDYDSMINGVRRQAQEDDLHLRI